VRIVIIGAGGWEFPLRFTRDVLARPALRESQLVLYDLDRAAARRTCGEITGLAERFGRRADVVVAENARRPGGVVAVWSGGMRAHFPVCGRVER